MTQNNEILERITGQVPSTVSSKPSSEDAFVPQVRVVTVRYKVYSAILLVLLAIFLLEWLPAMQGTFRATRNVYDQTQTQIKQLTLQKSVAQSSKVYLEEIEATQSLLETCLNKEDPTACASLPETWNITYKERMVKDFSIPLSYLQLNSLHTPKMPVDEKKVLRNLNEYLIRDGVVQGVNVKNGDIETIIIGDPKSVDNSSVFYAVPIEFSIKFDRVRDLISFVRNVEKKLIAIPEDRILYKIQEVGYDIVASDQAQTTDVSMIAYYYHDAKFQEISQ